MPDESDLTMQAEYRGLLSEIPALGAAVEAFCGACGVEARVAHKLVLGLEELFTNLILHGAAADAGSSEDAPDGAASRVRVVVSLEGDRLVALYEDTGDAFDPLSVPAPDLSLSLEARQVGGLGVHLLRTLMDEVSYARVDGRNQVTLRLRR